MTAKTPGSFKVNVVLAASVGLVALLLFAALILATVAHWEVGAIIGLITGLLGVATPVLVLLNRLPGIEQDQAQLRQETQAQTATLEVLDRRTNGDLDRRIAAALDAAVARGQAAILNAPTAAYPTLPQQRGTVSPVPPLGTNDRQ